jgi:hypothetical protein
VTAAAGIFGTPGAYTSPPVCGVDRLCAVLVIVRRHHLIDEHDLAAQRLALFGDVVDVLHHRQLGAQRALGAHAHAQAQHGELACVRREHAQSLAPAHPVRHHDLLAPSIGEAIAHHFRHDPVDRFLERA